MFSVAAKLYRSFANRRQLASYVGVAPMPYQSGGMDRDRSISRAGNPRARTTLIQLAWLWLRYQPGSALATWKTVALPVSPQTVMSSAATLFFLRRGHRSGPDFTPAGSTPAST